MSVQKPTTVETGLSDFHNMVVVLKTTLPKQGATVINYRYYKNYNDKVSKSDLQQELQNIDPSDLKYSSFQNSFQIVFDKHAPIDHFRNDVKLCLKMRRKSKTRKVMFPLVVRTLH